jgi:hypothetical protein
MIGITTYSNLAYNIIFMIVLFTKFCNNMFSLIYVKSMVCLSIYNLSNVVFSFVVEVYINLEFKNFYNIVFSSILVFLVLIFSGGLFFMSFGLLFFLKENDFEIIKNDKFNLNFEPIGFDLNKNVDKEIYKNNDENFENINDENVDDINDENDENFFDQMNINNE